MSEVILDGGEVIEYEAPASTNLFRTDDPAEVLKRATDVANALAPVIKTQKLAVKIQGKDHVTVEGWQTLGAMLGVTAVCEWTRPLDNGWEARVEARTLDGRTIGAAEAECLRDEGRWKSADDYAVRSMAQTRATSKALASVLRFVATLAGFSGTPAEEMPRDGFKDAEPSTAQKSAITRRCNQLALTDEHKKQLMEWAGGMPLTKRKASKLIELLKESKDFADVWKRAGIELATTSDIPVDIPEEEVVDFTDDTPVPFS